MAGPLMDMCLVQDRCCLFNDSSYQYGEDELFGVHCCCYDGVYTLNFALLWGTTIYLNEKGIRKWSYGDLWLLKKYLLDTIYDYTLPTKSDKYVTIEPCFLFTWIKLD